MVPLKHDYIYQIQDGALRARLAYTGGNMVPLEQGKHALEARWRYQNEVSMYTVDTVAPPEQGFTWPGEAWSYASPLGQAKIMEHF
jgi:hypothetical protein